MKKNILLPLLGFMLLRMPLNAQTNVPDNNFAAAIALACPTCITGNTLNDAVCATQNALDVANKSITNLTGIAAFSSLTFLNCNDNNLSSIATLPTPLKELYVSNNNNLTTLPASLPSTLEKLWGYNCKFTSLPTLPSTLKSLFMDNNPSGGGTLTLPSLSGTALEFLHVQSIAMSSFPSLLPSTMKELYFSFNSINDANYPNIPVGLTVLRCANNPLVCLPSFPSGSALVELVSPSGVTCLPNKPAGLVTGNGASLPICSNGACGTPLFVSLVSFDATAHDNAVQLTWASEEEVDFKDFTVERSINGRDFVPLSKIAARGGGKGLNTYFFTDEMPLKGISYYRLRLNDKDGKYSFSKTRAIALDKKTPFRAYPNPVNNELTVDFLGSITPNSKVQLMDMTGRIVLSDQLASSQKLDLSALSSGMYLLKIIQDRNLYEQKIVKF